MTRNEMVVALQRNRAKLDAMGLKLDVWDYENAFCLSFNGRDMVINGTLETVNEKGCWLVERMFCDTKFYCTVTGNNEFPFNLGWDFRGMTLQHPAGEGK